MEWGTDIFRDRTIRHSTLPRVGGPFHGWVSVSAVGHISSGIVAMERERTPEYSPLAGDGVAAIWHQDRFPTVEAAKAECERRLALLVEATAVDAPAPEVKP